MTRNRNKSYKVKLNFDSPEAKQEICKALGIKEISNDQDCDKQPDNIVDELPLKQVLARL